MIKRIHFLWVVLLLSGCQTILDQTRTNDQIRRDMAIEPEEVKEQLAPTADRTASLGPTIKKSKDKQLEGNRRTYIDQMTISSDGNWKPFNVSLNFVDVDIRELAQAMSQISGVNILVGDDVDGVVTVKVNNVPWDKALDNILNVKGLAKSVDAEGNIIRIHKPETITTRDEFQRKRVEELTKQYAAKRIISTQVTEIFKLYYAKPLKLKSELEAIFGGSAVQGAARIPGSIIEITVDERLNSLIVKGTRQEIELVSKLVSRLDVRTRQVLIEAFVVEAADNFQQELGARLGYYNKNFNSSAASTYSGLAGGAASAENPLTLGTSTGSVSNTPVANPLAGIGFLYNTPVMALKAEITAMEKLGITKIVSNPKIFTMDNEEGVVIDGTQIPYPVPGVGTNQITYEFKDAALKLNVTPTIIGDGNVFLNLVVQKDSPDYTTNPPAITKREVRNRLIMEDNTIAVVGGIYTNTKSNTVDKTPWLADIPLLGMLFRMNAKKEERRELLVYISVKVLN